VEIRAEQINEVRGSTGVWKRSVLARSYQMRPGKCPFGFLTDRDVVSVLAVAVSLSVALVVVMLVPLLYC